MGILAEDLSVGFIREGHYIGWEGDAEEAVVFTPDGNHMITLEPADATRGWKITDAPGFTRGKFDADLVLANEAEIRSYVVARINAQAEQL